jgi:SSS family solute:Na+ symporter
MTRGLVVTMLASTALGAGSAILRAMSDATSTFGLPSFARPIWSRVLPVAFASLVAWRGQSLVEMMIELNLVYITAVGPLLGLALLKVHVSNRAARSAITAGCCVAGVGYLIRWSSIAAIPEAVSLCIGPTLSLLFALASRTKRDRPLHEATQSIVSPHRERYQNNLPAASPSPHLRGAPRER